MELTSEGLGDLLRLAFPHEAGVDEHARELVAHRLVHEGGGDRRVNPARETAQHALAADLRPDLGDGLLDDRRVGPRRAAAAHVVQERLEHLLAAFGVRDLGVELHAVHGAVAILERGDRGAGRRGCDAEAVGGGRDRVAVAHPHDLLVGQRAEQRRRVSREPQLRGAVLAPARVSHLAAQLLRDELGPVADAEHRHAGVVQRGIERRRVVDVDRRRATREDDPLRPPGEHLVQGHRARNDLRVHVRLAHAPGDQLRVLRPEVDDEDGVELGSFHVAPSDPCRRPGCAGGSCPRSAGRGPP